MDGSGAKVTPVRVGRVKEDEEWRRMEVEIEVEVEVDAESDESAEAQKEEREESGTSGVRSGVSSEDDDSAMCNERDVLGELRLWLVWVHKSKRLEELAPLRAGKRDRSV